MENEESAAGEDPVDENHLIAERRTKLKKLRERGGEFPNDFRRNALAGHLQTTHAAVDSESLEAQAQEVSIAGRLRAKRVMGKVSFIKLEDSSGAIQVFLQQQALGDVYDDFKTWDIGDIVAAEGTLFRTKTGELSVRARRLRLLTKSLRPLPDKWHGVADTELRYRRRYVDLIVNPDSRRVFETRSRIVRYLREFLDTRGFLEVETPMLQTIPGGAAARPFKTHHNALDMDMYLRIAPELYLKRLTVGGFERVYEINRNFRNEGISRRHNPEFTMLEAYWAFADFELMANLVEELICHLAQALRGSLLVEHKDAEGKPVRMIDLTPPWRRAPYRDLVRAAAGQDWFDLAPDARRARAAQLGVEVAPGFADFEVTQHVFEKLVEEKTFDPLFVTHCPQELVPLARQNGTDPTTVDVYELLINGQEISPGYSELNDPILQRERLERQAGEEKQDIDEDFLAALEHGMPPAGGIGIGIDRLVMMLTGAESIRDVIFFPQLKPK